MNALRPRAVLVVEDSDEDFDTIREAALQEARPVELLHAGAVEDAWVQLRAARARELHPAFVLLDNNLPGRNGIEFLREVRADPAHRCLPVVMFTTSTSPRDRDGCYEAGANAYHVKSVRYDECIATLRTIFGYWLGPVELPEPRRRRTETGAP